MFQYLLQRLKMNAVFAADLAFSFSFHQNPQANVSPHLHIRVHPFLPPVLAQNKWDKCIRVFHGSSADYRFTFHPAFTGGDNG